MCSDHVYWRQSLLVPIPGCSFSSLCSFLPCAEKLMLASGNSRGTDSGKSNPKEKKKSRKKEKEMLLLFGLGFFKSRLSGFSGLVWSTTGFDHWIISVEYPLQKYRSSYRQYYVSYYRSSDCEESLRDLDSGVILPSQKFWNNCLMYSLFIRYLFFSFFFFIRKVSTEGRKTFHELYFKIHFTFRHTGVTHMHTDENKVRFKF